MNRHDLRARIRRLEILINGLALEISHWRTCSAPVLVVDRIDYMTAIGDAIKGLETARVTLARIIAGLEDGRIMPRGGKP